MKIEVGKFYRTRDGKKVRIYDINGGGEYPIHGAYELEFWHSTTWNSEGFYNSGNPQSGINDIASEWEAMELQSIGSDAFEKARDHMMDAMIYGISTIKMTLDEPALKINWDKHRLQQKEEFQVGDIVEYLGGCSTWDNNKYNGSTPVGARIKIGKISDCGNYISVDKSYPEYNLPKGACAEIRNFAAVSISGGCACGGRLDTHKAECPESKDANGNAASSYTRKFSRVLEKDETEYTGLYYPRDLKKCECGAESIGVNTHSEWCDKHDKN